MRTARFFVPPEYIALREGAFAIPAGQLYKQIVSVLRMKVGDLVSLLPNDGTEIDGEITAITKTSVMGTIRSSQVSAPLKPEVTICAAVLKNDNFALVLEKCTELGAAAFLPMVTERTIKKTKEIAGRWQTIVKEASEQSGRTRLPIIHEPCTFAQALGKTDGLRRVVLHESFGETLPIIGHDDRIALFVGPEGGFTEHEMTLARDAASHIVHLGDLVLRAETAAIVGTALLRLK